MKEITTEVTFVILKGKYLLGRQEMGRLPRRKMCLGPNMPLTLYKIRLWCR